jgi:hypothetical protein
MTALYLLVHPTFELLIIVEARFLSELGFNRARLCWLWVSGPPSSQP